MEGLFAHITLKEQWLNERTINHLFILSENEKKNRETNVYIFPSTVIPVLN